MTSRIPKASSRTKSISLSSHNVNPSQVYHNLESLGLFKSKAGRSVSQADVQSLCSGSFGVMLDFLSSHLLGEDEVSKWRSAISSLYEDIQDEATLEEIFPPDATVGNYCQLERNLKHQRKLKEDYVVRGANLEGELKQHEDSSQELFSDYPSIKNELCSIRRSSEGHGQQLQVMRNLQTLVERLPERYLDVKPYEDDALLLVFNSVSNYETKVRQLLPLTDFTNSTSVLQAIQNAMELSGEIKTPSPPQAYPSSVEETLTALEASWLKLSKSAEGPVPEVPEVPEAPDCPKAQEGQGLRRHLSEDDRELLKKFARSKARRRLATNVNSTCRSGIPSISRLSEASKHNVASVKEAGELISLSKALLPETRRMALQLREDVRNHGATTLPLLEQVPASTSEYVQESIRTSNPQPNTGA